MYKFTCLEGAPAHLPHMSFLFGAMERTPADEARGHSRTISRALRDMEREHGKLTANERIMLRDMKTSARNGEIASVKAMASELVRTRAQMAKLSRMKAHMRAMDMRLKSGQSSQAMVKAMRGSAKVMKSMNAATDAGTLSKILAEFEKESSVLTDKQDFIDERMDDALGDGEDEVQDVNEVVAKVFAEIGVDIGGQMAAVPAQHPVLSSGAGGAGVEGDSGWEAEINARIKNLRA